MTEHTIQPGDCALSLAAAHGFHWQTLWDHPDNAHLRTEGRSPHTLPQGERIVIPDKTLREEKRPSEARHTFKLKGACLLRLRLCRNAEPLADMQYTLSVGGTFFKGSTDSDGNLEHTIPAAAIKGTLRLEKTGEEFPLVIGGLPPIDTAAGVQARLRNLGFNPGPITGEDSPLTAAALRTFQAAHAIEPTGTIDDTTRRALRDAHGV